MNGISFRKERGTLLFMRYRVEKAGSFKLAGLWVLSALLVILPTTIQAEEKTRLPDIQKAVGKDWSVTALPDGYLVTYLPLVRFYPAISEGSKRDDDQRAASGRMGHLRIRITLYPSIPFHRSMTVEQTNNYNAFLWAVHKCSPGYFACADKDWGMLQYNMPFGWPNNLSKGQGLVWFSWNLPPDALVSPPETVDVYEHALDAVAPLFHSARYEEWVSGDRPEEEDRHSELKGRLPELQKAVGKDWSVTALPNGYLVTSVPLVSFDHAISKNSKMDGPQQTTHEQTDHLRIKIIFGPCLTAEEMKEYGPVGPDSPSRDGLKSAPHYFLCNVGGEEYESSYVFRIGQPDIWFITNLAPDETVSPKTMDTYQQALGALGAKFHCFHYVIED